MLSDNEALLALLSTTSHEAAAKQAGLTSRTLRRYLETPEFRDVYLQRRRELMSQAIVLAQQNALNMVWVLIDIANDSSTPASVRVSAANNVYSIGDNGLQTEDLAAQITELAAEVEQLKSQYAGGSRNGHRRGVR